MTHKTRDEEREGKGVVATSDEEYTLRPNRPETLVAQGCIP
jgi:hypothetical protein